MSRLVSTLIDAARDQHAAFDRQRTPNGPLYRFLANYCQEVQGKIMAIDPTYGSIEQTIVFSLPLDDFDSGLAIGPGRLVSDIVAVTPESLDAAPTTRSMPVPLLDRQQRFARNGPRLAAWLEGETLYLRAPSTLWTDFGTIEVQVVQNFIDADVTALQAGNAVLPLPDASAGMVVAALALFMARRGHADAIVPPIDVSLFAASAAQSAEAFYDSVRQRHVGRTFFTADVRGDW